MLMNSQLQHNHDWVRNAGLHLCSKLFLDINLLRNVPGYDTVRSHKHDDASLPILTTDSSSRAITPPDSFSFLGVSQQDAVQLLRHYIYLEL
jgi:hypothetical protein